MENPGLPVSFALPRSAARWILIAASSLAWGQVPPASNLPPNHDSCGIQQVTTLPGSHHFGSDFIEAMATDPDPKAQDSNAVWGLTADLSSTISAQRRAIYISKTVDGGKTWTQVARLDANYFEADIGEGLRNGLSISPGGADFVVTTEEGAFQVIPKTGGSDAAARAIAGPKVPHPRPRLSLPKNEGDPVMAGVVRIADDGRHMIIGYGHFDLDPQLFAYRRDERGWWMQEKPLPRLPTQMDILSMEFEREFDGKASRSLYVGTGDQAYRLNLQTLKWTRIAGVGPDSAIHGMSLVNGPHLAACWGVYNPISADAVERVTDARFLLHRAQDEVGPNIRAYGIEVDPLRPNREVVTAITGVYTSEDSGRDWKRLNELPEGEFRSAHFNADGTVIVSGIVGTFVADPFSSACSPRLQRRDREIH
jgi:hypothetical protein